MDDGAADVETSCKMLEQLKKQGVDTVFLTPHYYSYREDIQSFLERRAVAYEQLCRAYDPENAPKIRLGAEIRIARDISREDLSGLALQGTDTVILEFPYGNIDRYVFEEIEQIIYKGGKNYGLKVMIAHVDRVLRFYGKDVLRELFSYSELICQINAESFGIFPIRELDRGAKQGVKFTVGTDCHDLYGRAPNYSKVTKAFSKGSYENIALSVKNTTQTIISHR